MAGLDELLELIPVNQIAARLGVDAPTAQQGIESALPAILGGLGANAQDPAGAASLGGALANKDTSLIEGGVNVDDIDTADGSKIVKNVFGDNTDAVAWTLGAKQGDTDLVSKLLPMLAPIVLAYLAKRSGGATQQGAASGGGLTDLIGGLLSGQSGGGALGGSLGGGLGDLLGGLLGGGKR